jgi:isopropylmalate/homocitrate/citramalate synthase
MLKQALPKCNVSMNELLNNFANASTIFKMINPKLFDVSLRDGLQSLDESMYHLYPLQEKKRLYYKIRWGYTSTNIEIGSLVNPRIMPIMGNSLELFKEIVEETEPKSDIRDNHYMLVPNRQKFNIAIQNNVRCFSLVTSVSNSFQRRNVNMSIDETKEELKKIDAYLESMKKTTNVDYKTKLYISCINKCPIEGVINNDFIVNQILYYYSNYKFNQICLSDTCGTLNIDDYEYIVDTCIYFGLPPSKIGLHLHFNAENDEQLLNAKKIVHYSFDKKIRNFDVSILEYGGCSMTLKKEETKPNMTYNSFYEFLVEYIQNKS